MRKITILIFGIILFVSCSEREKVNLGRGYRFDYSPVISGDYAIFGPYENTYAVAEDVLRFNFDSTFIIAEQKPREIFFKTSLDETYNKQEELFRKFELRHYWVINKIENKMYGPMNYQEFRNKCIELNIQESLMLLDNKK